MLNFGKANAKLIRLEEKLGKRIATFSLLAGVACPYAKDCKSQVVETDNGRRIKDGPDTVFRCFSASQEVLFKNTYESRKENLQNTVNLLASGRFVEQFLKDMPKKAEVIRMFVSGDYKNLAMFDAMIEVANLRPDVLFYGYTKSLPFWVKRLDVIPDNFVLTASKGGAKDALIEEYGLRSATVVGTEREARKLRLPIDHDDSHAANPKGKSFALLVHGPQPKGSAMGKARHKLMVAGKGQYSDGNYFNKY